MVSDSYKFFHHTLAQWPLFVLYATNSSDFWFCAVPPGFDLNLYICYILFISPSASPMVRPLSVQTKATDMKNSLLDCAGGTNPGKSPISLLFGFTIYHFFTSRVRNQNIIWKIGERNGAFICRYLRELVTVLLAFAACEKLMSYERLDYTNLSSLSLSTTSPIWSVCKISRSVRLIRISGQDGACFVLPVPLDD